MTVSDSGGGGRSTFLELREVLSKYKHALIKTRELMEESCANEERVRNFVDAMVEKRETLEEEMGNLARRSGPDVLNTFIQYAVLPADHPGFPEGPLTAQRVAEWLTESDNLLVQDLRNMAGAMQHDAARETFEAAAEHIAQHVRTVAFHAQHGKGV
jgi:hypothetical protein